MKNVTVFGGSGFLGSHVADALTEAGYQVKIFDLKSSPYLRTGQEMVLGDITEKSAVMAACQGADFVYNFAGLADINVAKNEPELTVQLNIVGNINILEGARKWGAKRFVFASSVYVYSESGSFYRASKQASERFIELYHQTYALPFTILRYGSLYGRRADMRNNIYRLLHSALTKGEIHYNGTGEELREYIHVSDAAKASVDILDAQYANQHVVLTGPQMMKVKDIMVMISEMLGGQAKLYFDAKNAEAHYNVTPYAYRPILGKKLLVNPFIDLGQGILDCAHEVDEAVRSGGRDA